MDHHPVHGGVEIVIVASCYGNRDKLWPDGPLGLYAVTIINCASIDLLTSVVLTAYLFMHFCQYPLHLSTLQNMVRLCSIMYVGVYVFPLRDF